MSDSRYYMPPSTHRRDAADDRDHDRERDRSGTSTAVSHPAVKRESTWRPGSGLRTAASSTSAAASTSASTSAGAARSNAWAKDSTRETSPGPSQSGSRRNDSYYEPPEHRAADRDRDRDRDRSRERDRDRDRDRRDGDRDRGGWRRGGGGRADRDDDRGSWDDYRRRMDNKRRESPDRDRDRGRDRGWGWRKDKDDDRRWGSSGAGRADRWRGGDDKSPEDAARRRSPSRSRSRSRDRSRSRSRDRSPPTKRARRLSLSDSDSDSDRGYRRSPRYRSPSVDGKRRTPPSPRLPDAKRARDSSPRRRRSPSRGRSSSRSPTPPPRRKSSSPQSVNGRDTRPRLVDTPPRAYGPRSGAGAGARFDGGATADNRDRDSRDRWQPQPPRGPREFEQQSRFGRQPFSQANNGPVKMRKWGAARSRSPSPGRGRRSSPVPTGPPSAASLAPVAPVAAPTGPAADQPAPAPVIPPGFRRPPPTGPRQREPPTGPANMNGNGNGSPQKPQGGWRPIQQPAATATEGFKRALAEPTDDSASGPTSTPGKPHSPRRSDQWSPSKSSPNRWSPSRGGSGPAPAMLQSSMYLDRLAESEQQYHQHLTSVAPYVSAAFSQWYGQHTTPHLPEFLVHYFGRRPSKFELDQIHALLNRRTQLARDTVELRNLHEQALSLERKAAATPREAARAPRPQRARPGEAYERIAQVGEGTYGKVYKARSVNSGILVALKRIRMEQEKDGFPVTSMREIKLLQALHHPNVVHLHEMMVSKGSVYMVLEYMNHDLTGILSHPEVELSAANVKSLNYQMLSGLGYLHRRGILHRDMKGSNILLNGAGELKLADFGLARFYHKHRRGDYTNRVITLWYRSPELLMGETCYGPEVDTWSAGCIALEIFTAKPVFQGSDEINQLEVIYGIMGTPDPGAWPGITELPWYELVRPKDNVPTRFRATFAKWLSPGALDLVEQLLAFNPADRLLADDALQMPYFTDEEPRMERPTQLARCGEHHEMSVKQERHRRREGK